ncbi:aminoglycoside phosphotransferase family protein [Streptomyces sp. NPDC052236]|uniref:aminoglycoside phosphotransferase family protein n=1 Tax=Streptomyces sp. NPDC052236 TaxID=3365686 RepID=UPI0037CF262B
MAFEPPQRLVRAVGENNDWLRRLPELTQEAVDRHGLAVERVMAPGGRSSLVVLVRQPDGTPATLKIAPPFAAPALERAALEHWDGWGTVRLLAYSDGALLLERLHPEVSLRSLPEAKALLEAAGTVRRLWVEPPADHGFRTVAEHTAGQAEALRASAFADPATADLVAAALAARDELIASSSELLLLHGNFRQGKVLAADRTPWLAVGPEPLVGERAYDLARLARDRIDDLIATSAGPSATRRRVGRLADSLEVDRERLRGWTLFRAVESGARAVGAGRRQEGELCMEFASWL